ncbi:MAG: hypothetical protein ACXW0R_08800 [Gaiellaceae bacterium]
MDALNTLREAMGGLSMFWALAFPFVVVEVWNLVDRRPEGRLTRSYRRGAWAAIVVGVLFAPGAVLYALQGDWWWAALDAAISVASFAGAARVFRRLGSEEELRAYLAGEERTRLRAWIPSRRRD